MKDEMSNWVVCGRAIGRVSDWDHSDTFSMMLYDFEPAPGCIIPPGDCLIRFENGTVEQFNDDGTIKWTHDLIDAIKHLAVSRTD